MSRAQFGQVAVEVSRLVRAGRGEDLPRIWPWVEAVSGGACRSLYQYAGGTAAGRDANMRRLLEALRSGDWSEIDADIERAGGRSP